MTEPLTDETLAQELRAVREAIETMPYDAHARPAIVVGQLMLRQQHILEFLAVRIGALERAAVPISIDPPKS